jgi:hypothetical protein
MTLPAIRCDTYASNCKYRIGMSRFEDAKIHQFDAKKQPGLLAHDYGRSSMIGIARGVF